MTVTHLGQFDPGNNRGTYTLSLVRAEDNKVLATADLDMSQTYPDAMGFKYARLAQPVQLEAAEQAGGHLSARTCAHGRPTTCAQADLGRASAQKAAPDLMAEGISLEKIAGRRNDISELA